MGLDFLCFDCRANRMLFTNFFATCFLMVTVAYKLRWKVTTLNVTGEYDVVCCELEIATYMCLRRELKRINCFIFL